MDTRIIDVFVSIWSGLDVDLFVELVGTLCELAHQADEVVEAEVSGVELLPLLRCVRLCGEHVGSTLLLVEVQERVKTLVAEQLRT